MPCLRRSDPPRWTSRCGRRMKRKRTRLRPLRWGWWRRRTPIRTRCWRAIVRRSSSIPAIPNSPSKWPTNSPGGTTRPLRSRCSRTPSKHRRNRPCRASTSRSFTRKTSTSRSWRSSMPSRRWRWIRTVSPRSRRRTSFTPPTGRKRRRRNSSTRRRRRPARRENIGSSSPRWSRPCG